MKKRLTLCLLLVASFVSAQTKYQKDFNFYWQNINQDYAYFDQRGINWDKAKQIYQPQIDTVSNRASFIRLLEQINNEFYNGHVFLNTNLPTSNRMIPSGSDMQVAYERGKFVITSVRQGYNAEKSGLLSGMVVSRYNDENIMKAVAAFLPKSVTVYTKPMYEYAANMLLAGTHNGQRKITVVTKATTQDFNPDQTSNKTEANSTNRLLESSILTGNTGYIKINNSLGNNELIKALDKTLDSLQNTQALILDLRETPNGGNTTVARGIMSRFITQETPYQKHSLPAEEKEFGVKRSWLEIVSSRGKAYTKPLYVLAGAWTGSMGEGLVMAFNSMQRSKTYGEKMAGLLGAVTTYHMPQTGINFSFPTEKLFSVKGVPRENFVPEYPTDGKDALSMALQAILSGKK
jgi:C-terminal processing protease CtpA/Prc